MYALNPLPTNVLITPDEVLRYFTGNSVDPNIFSAVIQVAETRFAIPLLGYPFYQQLCTQKNITVTTANQATLQAMFPATYNTLQPGNIVNAIDLVGVSPEKCDVVEHSTMAVYGTMYIVYRYARQLCEVYQRRHHPQ